MKFSRSDYNNRIIDKDNKIPIDEPVFLLRAKDSLAPRMLLNWALELRLAGGDPDMAREAENHAQEMIEWQKVHGCKTPDMYVGVGTERGFTLDKLKTLIKAAQSREKVSLDNITRYAIKYYGHEKFLKILMPMDLKLDRYSKDPYSLQFEDFDLNDNTIDELNIAKLIIYAFKGGLRILKFEI